MYQGRAHKLCPQALLLGENIGYIALLQPSQPPFFHSSMQPIYTEGLALLPYNARATTLDHYSTKSMI
jgi:hypothetical protein